MEATLRFSYRWLSAYGNTAAEGALVNGSFDAHAAPLHPRATGVIGADVDLPSIHVHGNTQVRIAGPRGTLSAFSVALDWPPHASAVRQASVRHLVSFVLEVAGPAFPTIICGDFNAPPDSDELRVLTGRTDTAAPGFALFDAWEMAGDGSGQTWARSNPWTAPALLPDKRIDYILVGRPRRGGAGHVVRCSIEGTAPMGGVFPSDHYAVVADLRY